MGMNGLVDWWTVRGDRWGVKDFDFKIELEKQGKVGRAELIQYSERDLARYGGGDWCFVKMRVVPVNRDLTDLISFGQVLSGIEWGEMENAYIDREDITDNQAKEAAIQAVRMMRKYDIRVATEMDSNFTEKATTAPF